MSTGRDDDALSWDGDDDPTLDTRAAEAPTRRAHATPAATTPAAATPQPEASAARAPETTDAAEASGSGNVALVALGVLGGIYLLLSLGWLVGGLRLQAISSYLVARDGDAPLTWAGGNAIALVLAVAAPAIWFVTTLVLSRRAAAWVRWVVLAAGAVLLLPWPFIMVGAIGS